MLGGVEVSSIVLSEYVEASMTEVLYLQSQQKHKPKLCLLQVEASRRPWIVTELK